MRKFLYLYTRAQAKAPKTNGRETRGVVTLIYHFGVLPAQAPHTAGVGREKGVTPRLHVQVFDPTSTTTRHQGREQGYSLVAWLSHLTIDHAPLSRRGTTPTPNRDTSNIWALIALFPHSAQKILAGLIPSQFRRLWPPSIP